jgi:hypothetical protein
VFFLDILETLNELPHDLVNTPLVVQAIPSLHLPQKIVLWRLTVFGFILTIFINLLLSFVTVVLNHQHAILGLDYLIFNVPQLS